MLISQPAATIWGPFFSFFHSVAICSGEQCNGDNEICWPSFSTKLCASRRGFTGRPLLSVVSVAGIGAPFVNEELVRLGMVAAVAMAERKTRGRRCYVQVSTLMC